MRVFWRSESTVCRQGDSFGGATWLCSASTIHYRQGEPAFQGRLAHAPCAVWLAALLLLAPFAAARAAAESGLELSLASVEGEVAPEAMLAGQFAPIRAEQVLLAGNRSLHHWLMIRAAAAPLGQDGSSHLYLRIDQEPLNTLTVHQPGSEGWQSQTHDVYFPTAGQNMSATGLNFRLAHPGSDAVVLLLEVQTDIDVTLRPRLLDEAGFNRLERRTTVVLSAVYSGLLLLVLNAMVMYLALRERSYLRYLGFVALVLALLLALNGQLYFIPGLGRWSWWGALGVLALGHALAASALVVARDFASLGKCAPRVDRLLRLAKWPFLVMALVCALNLRDYAPLLQMLSTWLWAIACLLIVFAAIVALRYRRPLAGPLLLVWLLVGVTTVARSLVVFGLAPQGPLLIHGFQIALAFAAFLLSLALADRVIEFRRQRDRTHRDKEQMGASLQFEQARRQFIDGLQSSLRGAPPGDLEWVAFRRLLETIRSLVHQSGSAVVVFGYHDHDLLLAEPMPAKEDYSTLLKERGGAIKGLCRGHSPVQLHLPASAPGPGGDSVFAVVPMPVAKPGWGAVLVERPSWESFEQFELELIVDLVRIACATADEAAALVALNRQAELDPLTGALNRRAMDARLDSEMEWAHAEKEPLSVLFLDLDNFKLVNDRFGHAVGDDCLRLLADIVRRETGVNHVFGRYGGEEFVVALPGQPPDLARTIGERIRIALTQERIDADGTPVRLTVSIGIAARLTDERQPRSIMERADKALYAAKTGGRNQVRVAPAYSMPGSASDAPPFL